jgi:DNA-binding response OmpR family regulator
MPALFIVEDDAIIRMMLVDMAAELGHTVAAEAGDLKRGLGIAAEGTFDLAILDLELLDGSSEPIAEALASRNIPFAFASGYSHESVPKRFRDHPVLQKPFRIDQLQHCIDALLSKPRPHSGCREL